MKSVLCVWLAIIMISETQQLPTSEITIELTCLDVFINTYSFVGQLVQCDVDSAIVTTSPKTSIVSVSYQKESELTDNRKIGALCIENAPSIKFIPNGINVQLSNLRAFLVKDSGLLSVSNVNLRQFGSSLEILDLTGNELSYIDADLFDFNPNLKDITFYNNPIRHISPDFFKNLQTMDSIDFIGLDKLSCMSQNFAGYLDIDNDLKTFSWKNEACFNSKDKKNRGSAGQNEKNLNVCTNVMGKLDSINKYIKRLYHNQETMRQKIEKLVELNEESLENNNEL